MLLYPRICKALVAGIVGLAAAPVWAASLAAFPPKIQLDNARDPQRIVVVKTRDDGVTLDVTKDAIFRVEPATLATWSDQLRLNPAADGEGQIIVEYAGETLSVPLKVQGAGNNPPMSFRNDIEPVIMRSGCNSGACHGAASGKNGFKLTLFGFDAAVDYDNLTRDARARRMDAAKPAESLMLLKPTGGVDHEGGTKIEKDGPLYQMVHRWIAEGANNDPAELPTLTGIEILPPAGVLEGAGATQRFVVQASYSDGTDRDVTDLAVLASGDDAVVAIDGTGLGTSGSRGETYLMARFGTFAMVSQFISIPADTPLNWPDVQPKNFVDEFIHAKLKKMRVAPAEVCSDEVFLRRAYIDTLGVLPTVEEARTFLSDTGPEKRGALIDQLLQRPEFNDVWAMKWAEALRVRSIANVLDPKAMHRYNDWLRQSIQGNKPINELVRELLGAEGGTFTSPASNFYMVVDQPPQMAENVAQVFMGVQIQCAQCHNHPFERWTMNDYYSFSAFFAQVGKKGSSDPREFVVFNRASGEVNHVKSGQVMAPKFLGGAVPDLAGRDRRAVLAEWLVSPENPWFAKNIANRVWEHFMGRGIIHPTDDVRVSNPPSNKELLDELGKRFVAYNYDMRQLIRDICNSNTYQASTQPRDPAIQDVRNFSVAQVRRLPSEMLLDAISEITETKVKFASLPLGARAVQVADGNAGNYFLQIFGRPTRESACTCERKNEPTLAQTLHLINGDTLTNAIQAGDSRLTKRINEQAPTEQIVEELYLAAYSRPPRSDEAQLMLDYVAKAPDRSQALQDTYWSILNSKEFVFNH